MPTFVLDFFHCFHGLLCVSVHRFRRLPACIFSLTSDFLQIPPHDGHPCLRLTLSTAEGVVVFHHLVVAHAGRTAKNSAESNDSALFLVVAETGLSAAPRWLQLAYCAGKPIASKQNGYRPISAHGNHIHRIHTHTILHYLKM